MEAYAAQVDSMDQNIAKVLDALDAKGVRENTFVMFLSDNGASLRGTPARARRATPPRSGSVATSSPGPRGTAGPSPWATEPSIIPGPEDTYASYGRGWANLSNTPFRLYKEWIHEGGVASPTVISWPAGDVKQGVSDLPLQLVDVVPTVLEAAGVDYPEQLNGRDLIAAQGESFLGLLRGQHRDSRPLYWEHIGNAGIRIDDWKLVRAYPHEWELYDTKTDPTELHNVAAEYPDTVAELTEQWEAWARRAGVVPWPDILASYRARGLSEQVAKGS